MGLCRTRFPRRTAQALNGIDIMAKNIDKAFKQATIKLKKVNENINDLPRSVATFLIAYSAQGVIDNGGYRYFFEADWPNNPPYSKFVEAYFIIGCVKQSQDIDRVVSTFPFENPHLNESRRIEFIEANYDEDELEVPGWGEKLCGDTDVWEKLEGYYLENINDFV